MIRKKPNREEVLDLIKSRKEQYKEFAESFNKEELESHEPKDVRRLMISQVISELDRILDIVEESDTNCPVCGKEFKKSKQRTGHMNSHSKSEKRNALTKVDEEIELR